MTKLAFIGLGVMGYPMAGHLARKGYDITVYNRTHKKAQKWQKSYGGKTAKTPKEAAQNASFVLSCVGNDNDLKDIFCGKTGALEGMKPNTIFIDHSTVSEKITKELFIKAAEKNVSFIDAPVSGGQAGAEKGQLSIMCGGKNDAFTRAEPIISTYAKICQKMGASGSGQLTKMVNQICIAGLIQGLAEGLHFAEKAGLNIRDVVHIIQNGAAGSWQMSNRYETMANDSYDFGFAVDWMRKDLGICLETANQNGASLPVTALVEQFYKDIQNFGGGRWDTSSLIKRLRKLNKTENPL